MIISCGIIPIRELNGVREYLLLRNRSHWDFPKGKREQGETDLDCAARETAEEAGLLNPVFSWGEKYYETEPYSKPQKIARYFIAEFGVEAKVELLPNPEDGKIEHEEFEWVEFEAAMKLLKPRIQKALIFAHDTIEREIGRQKEQNEQHQS